jgi:hypothetical protein
MLEHNIPTKTVLNKIYSKTKYSIEETKRHKSKT